MVAALACFFDNLQQKEKKVHANKLIIVPGHAIYKYYDRDPTDEEAWILQDFQKGQQEFYIEHIEKGVQRAHLESASILVFSGGKTCKKAGPLSEAAGYYMIADEEYEWFGYQDVRRRVFLEENSRDSYQNILFSIDVFREEIGRSPQKVIVLGWKFKHERFIFHAKTIGIADIFEYVGVNNPPEVPIEAERKTLEEFRKFPQGDGGGLLKKRIDRDWRSD